jgi:hypothetical protein
LCSGVVDARGVERLLRRPDFVRQALDEIRSGIELPALRRQNENVLPHDGVELRPNSFDFGQEFLVDD